MQRSTAKNWAELWGFSGRQEGGIMWSRDIKIMMMKPTETADLRKWEFRYSEPTAGTQHGTELGPLYMGKSCVTLPVCGALGSGIRIYPWYMNFFFLSPFPWWDTLFGLTLDTGKRYWALCQLDIP